MANNIQRVIEKALTKLRSEKSRIDRQISALETALGAVRNSSRNGLAPRNRRKMSVAARQAIAGRMKEYWAKRRAGAKAQTKKATKG